jgi:pSer/pThr/pTyr-binding forkhead associated (FHA) protein
MLSRVDELGEPAGGTVVLTTSPTLTIRNGPSAGAVFDLGQTSATSIGRGPGNEIVLSDEAVSSQHCRIRPEGGRFVVHDLESTNGTFVNERRVERHMLAEGDVIRLGETWLEFGLYGAKR